MSSIKPSQRSQNPLEAGQTSPKQRRAEHNPLLAGIGAGRTSKSTSTNMLEELDHLGRVLTRPQAVAPKGGSKPLAPHLAKKGRKSQEHIQDYLPVHRPWSNGKRRVEPKNGTWSPLERWKREGLKDQTWNPVAGIGRTEVSRSAQTGAVRSPSSVGAERGSSCRDSGFGR